MKSPSQVGISNKSLSLDTDIMIYYDHYFVDHDMEDVPVEGTSVYLQRWIAASASSSEMLAD